MTAPTPASPQLAPRAVLGLLATLGLAAACSNEASDPATATTTTTATTPSSSPSGELSRDEPSAPVVGTEPLFNGQPPEVQVSDASAEPDVSDARLATCIPSKGPGADPLIDDFEDGDENLVAHEGLSGLWYSYQEHDGDHRISFEQLAAPRLGSTGAVHTSGSDHGAWAGIGVVLSGCVYDASRYVGVHFWIRGTSDPIDVALTTPGVLPVSSGGTCTKEAEGLCYDAYRSEISITEQWREVFVPFSTFEQDGYGPSAGELDLTRIESIQFQSNSSAFDLWIDDLSFYTEEVYTPYDASVPDTEPATTQVTTGGPEPTTSADSSGASSAAAPSSESSGASVAPGLDGGSQ